MFPDEEFGVVKGRRSFLEILSFFFNFAASQLLMPNRAEAPSLNTQPIFPPTAAQIC